MNARRRLIIPIAVVAIGAGVWVLWPRNNNPTGSIQASGTIEATQVGVAPKIAGRVMKISVQEGQQVEAGQVVAELDAAEVDAQARQAQAAVDAARTRPAQADASVSLARASVDAQLVQARAQIESALAALEAYKANVAAAEANLQAIETNLARAESDLARLEALYRDGAVSAEQIDTARAAAKALRAQRDAARAQRDAAQIQLGAAGAGVAQARAALAVAEANRQTVGIRQQDAVASRAQLAQAQALLQQAEILRSYTILKAPMAGVVVAKNVEVGDLVGVGAPVVTVADLSQVYLRVFVSESDLARVKLGQPVDVRVDGFSGRTFRGTVDQINSSAEFTPRNVQTKEERVKLIFGVKVALPNPDGVLKPGLPADAVILVAPPGPR
jgi:HlyD family secretion protein